MSQPETSNEHTNSAAWEWMSVHRQEYEILFDDGLTPKTAVEEAPEVVALTALARNTSPVINRYNRPTHLIAISADVYDAVDGIIDTCMEGGYGASYASAFTEADKNLLKLKEGAHTLIMCWEQSLYKRKITSPFEQILTEAFCAEDLQFSGTNLVLMTAMSILALDAVGGRAKSMPPRFRHGLRYYGPKFTKDFLGGKDMTESLGKSLALQTSQAKSERARLLQASPLNLAQLSEKFEARIRSFPATKELCDSLDWTERQVQAFFTPAAQKRLATDYTQPYDSIIKRLKYLYNEVLTFANIANEFGICEDDARATFKPGDIRELVLGHLWGDPIFLLKKQLSGALKIKQTYPAVPPSLAMRLMRGSSLPKALKRAKKLYGSSDDSAAMEEDIFGDEDNQED